MCIELFVCTEIVSVGERVDLQLGPSMYRHTGITGNPMTMEVAELPEAGR